MSAILEPAAHLALKHTAHRQACKQNMAHITQVTDKHLYFFCKLCLIVTILKTQG